MADPKLLENKAETIYHYLKQNLKGGKRRRIDYGVIARNCNCTRSTVAYNMKEKLIPLGFVGIDRGKLYLIKTTE